MILSSSRREIYIEDLSNDDRGDIPEIIDEIESRITQRELKHVLKGMPMNKNPGHDYITTVMRIAA